jgi:enoyl-[acyl-carrier protein] reductase II
MKASFSHLQRYLKKGQLFLGVDYPIICGAMSCISERNLVSAVANSGGFGVIAGGSLSAAELQEEIRATSSITENPFGINLVLHNKNFSEQFKAALTEQPDILVFAGAIPDGGLIKTAKKAGKKVMCFAPSLTVANILVEQGADALIIEGSESGGHIGSNTTLTLIQEVLLHIDETPVFVAGGIGTGEIMATCFLLGAAGVQVGTRFAASVESVAHPLFKKAYLKAKTHNTMPFTPPPGVASGHSIRCIKNAAYADFAECVEKLREDIRQGAISTLQAEAEIEAFWNGRLRDAVVSGNVKTGALMSGESVAFVHKIEKVKDILSDFLVDGEQFLSRITLPSS